MSAACRRCDAAKSTTFLFDIHVKIAEFGGMSRIGEQLQQRELERLPGPLLLAQELPPNAKMGLIIQNLQDGTMNVLKMIHFPDKVGIIHAKKLCTGDVYVPVHRPGPWALRKAVQHLLQRLPGYRVLWNTVSEKHAPVRRSQTAQLAPEDDDLRRGIDYINDYAPEGDARNEQTFCMDPHEHPRGFAESYFGLARVESP